MDLKRKLSSRKFWVCICGLVSAMLALFRLSGSAGQVTALLMALGSVVSYLLSEGWVDAAAAEQAQPAGQAQAAEAPAAGSSGGRSA